MTDRTDWILLGSGADCDVRIAGPNVASHHARCRMEANGRVLVEDLGTPGGTAINRPGSRIGVQYLNPADTIYLAAQPASATTVYAALLRKKDGSAKTLPGPPPAAASSGPSAGVPQLRVDRGVTVIGRDPDPGNKQRVVLAGPLVSRNHAGLLRTEKDEYYLWDLGSTYGTFLDGARVGTRRTRVLPKALIGIAGFKFSVGEQGTVALSAPNSGIQIRADGISVEIGSLWRRRLNLDGIRVAIQPKTMLALMGPSGAGKTTLLRVLAGQSPPKAGRVLYGDVDIFRQFDQIRSSIGYVPQDDVLHPQLTVRQALFFSARLRLPADYSAQEIRQRVDYTMKELGIAGQADVIIGSTERRGISGGQRKRVNLAMELLPDPRVLLLDEPTSGLSSTDAERVVRTLRDLAQQGRTIVVTIHQPSPHVFEMFDQMALIDNDTVRASPPPPPQPGRLIFLGPVSGAPDYFQNKDVSGASRSMSGADVVFTSLEGNPANKTADWEAAFHASPYYRQYVEQPLSVAVQSSPEATRRKNLPSPLHQFSTLIRRLWRIKLADPWATWQMCVVYPLVVALGIALVSGTLRTKTTYVGVDYVKDFLRIGKTLFFGIFVAIWLGCNNTVREIVGELAVYRRERAVGLSLGAYLGSKLAFFAGVAGIQCLILVAVVSLICGLKGSLPPLFLLFWFAALCGASIGLLISTLAPGGEKAVQLAPLALLPMILFGGGVTRLEDMESEFARKIATVVPARWAFEGALLTENASRHIALILTPPGAAAGASPIPAVEPQYTLVHHYFSASPHGDFRWWTCFGALAIFAVVYACLAGLSLRLRDTH